MQYLLLGQWGTMRILRSGTQGEKNVRLTINPASCSLFNTCFKWLMCSDQVWIGTNSPQFMTGHLVTIQIITDPPQKIYL